MSAFALKIALKLVEKTAKKVVKSTKNDLDDRIFVKIKRVTDVVDKVL